jgi:formamidopyrimidine-DNA glycosylase
MPEVPEIKSRAREMASALKGKIITKVKVIQPKSLNMTAEDFSNAVVLAEIKSVSQHGKWIKIHSTRGWILMNLGMGGEILLVDENRLPEKFRVLFEFSDRSCLAINFWGFGYVHYCEEQELGNHPMLSKLGPEILELSEREFIAIIKIQKGKLKKFLLDQSKISGIGNAYIHDILFLAGLHPDLEVKELDDAQIQKLFQSIQGGLLPSLEKGGAFYEMNLFGEKGGFLMEDILIGYRENQPCPRCGTLIQKIKTGSTSSYLCPTCQPGNE